MNILFIKHFFVQFMVSEKPRVSVFGHCPYSVTFPYIGEYLIFVTFINNYIRKGINLVYIGESNRIRTVPEYGHSRYLRNHKSYKIMFNK